MPKLTRKNINQILEDFDAENPKATIDAIMGAYGESTKDLIPLDDLEEIKQNAVNDYLKENKPIDFKDSDDYKTLSGELENYKKKEKANGLIDKGVKKKYAEVILSKLDEEKDIDEQLEELKKEYEEMFEAKNDEESPKPQFADGVEGVPPTGEKSDSLSDLWGYKKTNN